MIKKYYSTVETAKILGVSRKTVFKWAQGGKIKTTRVGRNYIVPHSAILEKLGKSIGAENKAAIENAIDEALKTYGNTFKLLCKE